MNKIEKFIKENSLDFSGTGSDLNGHCVVLSGYALHLGLGFEELEVELNNGDSDSILGQMSDETYKELMRVFEYAELNSYGLAWETNKEYREKYIY